MVKEHFKSANRTAKIRALVFLWDDKEKTFLRHPFEHYNRDPLYLCIHTK